ncbi:MAG TPA: DUF3185 family protein [Verrucomicrobiae bacterium]|nr:DUF3185 family protein [Verrucomicrobiae bacterium]
MNKITGAICLAIGIVLLILGHNVAQSVDSQVKSLFTGSPTDKAVYYYIGGAILCAAGAAQLFWPRKKS